MLQHKFCRSKDLFLAGIKGFHLHHLCSVVFKLFKLFAYLNYAMCNTCVLYSYKILSFPCHRKFQI